MITLSMDLAFRNVGCSVFSATGELLYVETISTTKKEYDKSAKYISDKDLNALLFTLKEVKGIIDKYGVERLYCELSTGGKSANAAKGLAYSYSFLASGIVFDGLSYQTCHQNEVKKYVYKANKGDKDGIMDFVADIYGMEIKGTKYKCLGQWIGKTKFEHIADSIVAYRVCKEKDDARAV